MQKFELKFYLGDTLTRAEIAPEETAARLVYTCVINSTIVFKIRKNDENKWENLDGNSSAICKLIGWEIDNYLKQNNLRKKRISTGWDINLS